ncbi:MAG: tRNA (adenosine(37)-N6)-dimethylallyltransferase MiaA [Chloroflexota bacterium]
MTDRPPLLIIAGATATGKTGLAIRTAGALRAEGIVAEVISADSRQVFRGMDIGTAKPTIAERDGIRHHGLDLVNPDDPFSVADFAASVAEVLPGIAAQEGLAILAGGSGFYLRAIARGLDTASLPSNPSIRAEIEESILATGLGAAADRLRAIAPRRAASVDVQNPRRLARALEIATLSGDAPLPPARGYPGPIAWIGLATDAATHEEWIQRRAAAHFAGGLIEEARGLRDRFDPLLPAFSAIGYREAWAVIDGSMGIAAAIAEDVHRTVAFAKRQRTWFRREPEITWLDGKDAANEARVLTTARAILATPREAR